MSQQQFAPGPQEPRSPFFAKPWQMPRGSHKDKAAMPKNEHPATFEGTVPPYAYQAQDQPAREQEARSRRAEQSRLWSPDGDALENGYRPYKQWRYEGPGWMRRQMPLRTPHRHHVLRWIILILLAVALWHAIPVVLTIIVAVAGIIALAFLVPFIVIGAVVAALAVVVLLILGLLGVPLARR